ncbi:MAG: branched-chain amino acid transport system substrate-binding protein [Pseudonocardiales bacterium]|jgi:branched-chain amino acid transport system substrate-binding protein|nr:branched-chain amino acid transport system substrate-binding protein [Pseudonocardiales bacterium]MDT7619390.1 branched-chain amino acid transport system substrate-binding protein [Pseudonocardiales bacterium]MDT7692634.1 branched-chain amino acid transport system substrate-binding protein [Pseudonocardiales bacterium]
MAELPAFTRRRLLVLAGAAGAAAVLPGLSACGSSVGGGSAGSGGGGAKAVKVGLVVPQAGVYAAVGTDMQRGWELWLAGNGGKFGDYAVTTVVADEGETPQTGVPAVQKVLQSDGVDVVVGVVNSATALGVRNAVAESKKILIVANAGAADITGKARSPYIWRSSFTNAQVSSAMGAHLAQSGFKDGVYAIAPDYAAGTEVIAGFTKAFEAGGGKVVGSAKPQLGKTSDYQPFLSGIQSSGATATFAFFSGAEAITFVRQYAQFGLAKSIPLYGSGFLTEGNVLPQQADAALGVQTTLHYTDQLDNPANKDFVAKYTAKYGESPSCFSVQAWDAANVLNRALRSAAAVDGDTISAALGGVGTVEDSPRGPWTFEGQTPRQTIYLRRVDRTGGKLVNSVVQDLGQQSQPA